MKKRDKLTTSTGLEIDCNIVGFLEGICGKKIVIYTTTDNEREMLASYYSIEGEKFYLTEIENDEEWNNIEKTFKQLEEQFKNNKNI